MISQPPSPRSNIIAQNSSTLRDSLQAHRVEKNEERTHTSMGAPFGNFFYPHDELESLSKLVHYTAFVQNQPVYLTEINLHEFSDVKIDIDLRYSINDQTQRKYTNDFVKDIVMKYIKWMRNVFDIPEKHYNAFVMERDGPYIYKDKILKDGFHIQFPHIRCPIYIQHLMRQDIINECKTTIGDIGTLNNWEDIVDKCVIDTANWLMYGCRKPGLPPYKVTHIYNMHGQHLDVGMYSNLELVQLLSIRKDNVHANIKDSVENGLKDRWEKLQPPQSRANRDKRVEVKFSERARKPLEEDEIQLVESLIDILSTDRCESYPEWIRVGWCLFNISEQLYDLWDQWSQNSIKYEESACAKEWEKMNYKSTGLGIGTLHLWAKEDNVEEYSRIIQTSRRAKLCPLLDRPDESSIAEAFHIMYQDTFKCCDSDGKVWYAFNGNRWVETRKGLKLRMHISRDFVTEYHRREAYWSTRCAETDDEAQRKFPQHMKETVGKTTKILLQTTTKNKLMEESRGLFLDERFIERLNSNNMLIGFDNGVYDLENDTFRQGKPDDYISYSTGYDFEDHDMTNPDPPMKKLIEILHQIFPNEEVYEYAMKFISTGLWGKNRDTLFHFFTGVGSNGKTIVEELIKHALGDYCETIQTSMLTKKRQGSQNASADLLSMIGRRLIICAEPEQSDRITAGFMKLLTGGDNIRARGLYQEREITFKPQCKIVMICNDLPRIESNDMGTWRRIRAVEFISRFCDNPKRENEFKVDYNLLYTVHEYKERFMSLLLWFFKKYLNEGLTPPQPVIEHTEQYKRETDVYSDYINDRISFTEHDLDASKRIGLAEMFQDFKVWYKEAYPDTKCVTRNEMKVGVERIIGKHQVKLARKCWPRIAWKEDSEDYGVNSSSSDTDTEANENSNTAPSIPTQ